MKTMISTGIGLVIVATVLMGCGSKSEEPTMDTPVENQAPENVNLPEGHGPDDGHDHAGHNH